MRSFLLVIATATFITSCKKDDSTSTAGPKVNFIFRFDSMQVRLNSRGEVAPVPAGHQAQSPRFNSMSAHYLELTSSALTLPGAGQVLYKAPEVNTGGANAIDFSQSKFAGNNEVFLSVPLSQLAAGTYNYLRVSIAYQNFNVWTRVTYGPTSMMLDATFAGFIGFNTYIKSHKVKDSVITENANKLQGYWAFETSVPGIGGFVTKGQAPANATTVPNPLFASSPIPAGSCLVTGVFAAPLIVTGTETSDINIIVSLSTNKSFEWINNDGNTTYDPVAGDQLIDMGIRGMIPSRQ